MAVRKSSHQASVVDDTPLVLSPSGTRLEDKKQNIHGARRKLIAEDAFRARTEEEKKLNEPSFKQRFIQSNAALCDSYRFAALTMVLTIYALFGDDFRLSATHKDVDGIFNIITLVCIAVFTTELVASSFGRPEYFMGFFFTLDFVSTVTLVLDLTWVGNVLLCGGGGAQDEAVKTSRAGRAGARASRTVRIIRLLRLVKLYKSYRAAQEKKADEKKKAEKAAEEAAEKAAEQAQAEPGDDTDNKNEEALDRQISKDSPRHDDRGDDDRFAADDQKADDSGKGETRVGKKLSEMTTRRVIVLVLCMLFFLPQFSPESTQFSHRSSHNMADFQSSSHLGISLVFERWRSWCPASNTTSLPHCLLTNVAYDSDQQTLRRWYEEYLMNFIYTHHQGSFFNKLAWVGFKSEVLENNLKTLYPDQDPNSRMSEILGQAAQLGQEKYLGSGTLAIDQWDAHYIDDGWSSVNLEPLPSNVKKKLTQPWIEECKSYYGVAVSESISSRQPTSCSIDQDLRCSEVEYLYPETRTTNEEEQLSVMFAFDKRNTTQLEARLSILQTIFICAAVGIGTVLFSNDADHLLLHPIQRMIAKMETIKDNPLEAMRLGDLEYRREEMETARHKEELANKGPLARLVARVSSRKASQPMETMILEKTIIKLGGFLVVSFGENGAEIVGRYIRGNATVELDALVPGKLVNAIICFCGIGDFGNLLDSLNERITIFVNQVGEIVHATADDYGGSASKNYGDSFVLTWRLCHLPTSQQRRKVADMAVVSMIKVVELIQKSKPLSEYATHPVLQTRIPNFRPQVGFGMHCGMVAECAVGSEFKFDPLYLSQNTKITSQLQCACSQYGVFISMSHAMMTVISHEVAVLCRLIDHVSLHGSRVPLRIFTIDLDVSGLESGNVEGYKQVRNRFKIRQIRESGKSHRLADTYRVCGDLDTDEEFLKMRAVYTPEFFLRFSTAYRNYEAGAWLAAKDLLVTCHYKPDRKADSFVGIEDHQWPVDGPTVALLSFMKRTNFIPPSMWPGYRRLVLETHHH